MHELIVKTLQSIQVDKLFSFSELEEQFSTLTDLGWEQERIGFSKNNVPIYSFSKGDSSNPLMMAYGFPHPDEPLGATALFAFMLQLVEQHPLLTLFSFSIVLCADPDFAVKNHKWIGSDNIENFLENNVRPLHIGAEVDYHFPVDYKNLQFSINSPAKAYGIDPVLPESQYLADWIQKKKPVVLGLFHNEHIGGSFTYLSKKPSSKFIHQVDKYHKQHCIRTHWGNKTDPAEYWFRGRRDYLKEFSIFKTIRKLKREHDDFEDKIWLGSVSVGEFVESLQQDVTVITPEIGLWTSQHVDNQEMLLEEEKNVVWKNLVRLESVEGKLLHVFKAPQDINKPVFITRGMKFLEMNSYKRALRKTQNGLWRKFQQSDLYDSASLENINYNGVLKTDNDKSLITQAIYASSFQKPVTFAEFYDLETRYRLNCCLELSWAKQIYDKQGFTEGSEVLEEIIEREAKIISSQVTKVNYEEASRSMLYRWLLSVNI